MGDEVVFRWCQGHMARDQACGDDSMRLPEVHESTDDEPIHQGVNDVTVEHTA